MKRTEGFTIIEAIAVALFLGVAATLLLMQKSNLEAGQRDVDRKTAINAMYFNLEEVYFEDKGYYPVKISSKVLRAMDPTLFTDPDGFKLGDASSSYRYEPNGCENNKCKGYTLRADLEKEDDYVKTNR